MSAARAARAREYIHHLRGERRARRRGASRPSPGSRAAQSAQRRRPPCSTAARKARYESALVKQEEAVHAPVDPVEEQHPARRDERRGDERGRPAGEASRRAAPRPESLATANSAEKSRRPTRPPPRCATSQAKQEVERCAAALAVHRLEAGRPATRGRRRARASRPRAAARRSAARAGRPRPPRRNRATPSQRNAARSDAASTVRRPGTLLRCDRVPIYEYKCPNGHVFELFQGMNDPPGGLPGLRRGAARARAVPGRRPLQGLGFYSTDYGRGSKRRDGDVEDREGGDGGDRSRRQRRRTRRRRPPRPEPLRAGRLARRAQLPADDAARAVRGSGQRRLRRASAPNIAHHAADVVASGSR